ncbi:hypothetical protein [Bacillus toyonensis]|uniref:hypothetical protein n=1 Tax=Bacillus toyonensis TaxID=155322 RepID=UPI000BF7E537|nr:hypothetical protein [Bacillus toyonensis]PFY43894.1 hypothetical protein COL54_12735 [Bacillus toyonensis]
MAKKKSNKQPVIGICALCKKESTLEESHIVPKFAFRYLNAHSFTGRIRTAAEPNRPLQDGRKSHLLCSDCEDLFNKDETIFSNKVFHPFKKNELDNPVKYNGNWLNRFITSVNWRVLYQDLQKKPTEQDNGKPLPPEIMDTLLNAEQVMRSYLLNERLNLDVLENHIIFFNENVMRELFSHPHAIIQGSAFGSPVIMSKDAIYVISNLNGILVITIIKKHPEEIWLNSFVSNESGEIPHSQHFSSPLIEELRKLEGLRQKYNEGISKKQLEKLQEKIRKDPDGFKNSETYKRIMMNRKLK